MQIYYITIVFQVHLSFLYVGHTHEDVDAAFSKIADTLRRSDAETIPELQKLLPNVEEVIWQYDIREWLLSNINDIRKHTKPLHYKFVRDPNNDKVQFSYRENQNNPWKNVESGILKRNKKNMVQLPTNVPKLVEPTFDKIKIENLEKKISFWQCLFSDQLENTQLTWWKDFINKMKRIRDNIPFRKESIFSKAFWILPRLPRQSTDHGEDRQEDNNPPESVQKLLDAETQEHEVCIRLKVLSFSVKMRTV